jgi:tetrahydromethanopterin S-methyltransferase subunit F
VIGINNSSQFIGRRRKLLSGVRGDPTSVKSEIVWLVVDMATAMLFGARLKRTCQK